MAQGFNPSRPPRRGFSSKLGLDQPAETQPREDEEQQEGPSKKRIAAAAATRALTGLGGSVISGATLGMGSLAGGGVAGLGELLAQAIEEGEGYGLNLNQGDANSLTRAALEGGLAAIPGGWLFKRGKTLRNIATGAGVSGAWEYFRQRARGEDPSAASVGLSAGIGGSIGGVLSKFIKPPAGTPGNVRPPRSTTIDDLLQRQGMDPEVFAKELPGVMQKGGWKGHIDKILENARKLEADGKPEYAKKVREVGLSTGYWDPKVLEKKFSDLIFLEEAGDIPAGESLKLAKAALAAHKNTKGMSDRAAAMMRRATEAEKKAVDKEKNLRLAKERTEALKLAGADVKPMAGNKVSAVDPVTGETISYQEKITPKKADDDAAEAAEEILGGGGGGKSPKPRGPISPDKTAGVAPQPKTWQVVARETGVVLLKTNDPTEVEKYIRRAGPSAGKSLKVIEPAEIVEAKAGTIKAVEEAQRRLGGEEPPPAASAIPVEPTPPAPPAPAGAVAPIQQMAQEPLAVADDLGKPPLPPVKTVLTGDRVEELLDASPDEAVATGYVRPVQTGKVSGFAAEHPVMDVLEAEAKAKAAPPAPAAPIIDLAPALPAPAEMPFKEMLKYYKSISPVEDLKFLLRTGADTLPDSLKAKITTLLQSKKITKKQVNEAFDEARMAAAARDKAAGRPPIGTEAWTKEADALAGKVPEEAPSIAPGAPEAPPVGGVAPTAGKASAELLTPPTTIPEPSVPPVVAEPPVVPPAVVEPPVVAPEPVVPPQPSPTAPSTGPVAEGVPEAKPAPAPAGKRGGSVAVPQVLTPQEIAEVVNDVNWSYLPQDLANFLGPKTARYNELKDIINNTPKPLRGTPEYDALSVLRAERDTLGKEMKEALDEAVRSGLIEPGTPEEIAAAVKAGIKEANAAKFYKSQGPKVPSDVGTEVRPSPQEDVEMGTRIPPPKGEQEGWAGAYTDQPPVPTTSAYENLPADLDARLKKFEAERADFHKRAQEGAFTPEEAHAIANKLQIEMASIDKAILELQRQKPGGIGAGFGALQGLTPKLGIQAGMMAAGGLAGAVTDPLDDPILSAVAGIGAGALGAKGLIAGLQKLGMNVADAAPELEQAVRSGNSALVENASAVLHFLPHFQRANYLMTVSGLTANAFVGPYGAAFFGALTKGLAGDPRGWAAMRVLVNPMNWAKEYKNSWQDAVELIQRAESGDPASRAEIEHLGRILNWNNPAGTALRAYTGFPAWMMTAGDLASRKILMNHGFSEAEARAMTLTADPWLPSLQKVMNFRRGEAAPLAGLMAPFIRTPLNVWEQGWQRMPVVGPAVHKMVERRGADPVSMREKAVEQVIGVLIGTAAYNIGAVTPEEYSPFVKKFVSNAGGQYSLLASLAYIAGQQSRRTGEGFMKNAFSSNTVRQLGYSMPLPTLEPITDIGSGIGKLLEGKFTKADIPQGIYPSLVTEGGRVDALSNPPRSQRGFNPSSRPSSVRRRNQRRTSN